MLFREGRLALACIATVLVACLVSMAPAAEALPRLAGLAFHDLSGKEHQLGRPDAEQIIVLVFLGTECPVSNGYAPTLERLHLAQASNRVEFVGVHCDPDVSAAAAQSHAREYKLSFPLVLDHDQRLARACGVDLVPTAVVIAADGRFVYRGRIDNRYVASGLRRPVATEFDLQNALAAALAGRAPNPATTESVGCPLPPPRR